MARGGYFAGLQRRIRVAQREEERRQREATRHHSALVRRQEQTHRAAERARGQLAKAEAADMKRLEKAAREAHIAAREAEVEQRNEELSDMYAEVDEMLASTLTRDDFVDLATLRVEVKHPPFNRTDLERPVPEPSQIPDPAQPALQLPPAPRGLASFFGKRKHEEATEQAKRAHERALSEWKRQCEQAEVKRLEISTDRERAVATRLQQLSRERARYEAECHAREEDAAKQNRRLEQLITDLGYGTVDAIQEYVSIVLSNSVYPDQFSVTHEFTFDPETSELDLRVEVPEPSKLPTTKAFKYSKASDEIVATSLSQKECRERYAGAVHQVALRSFHEVFEADRRGLIRTISLEVGTTALDPGTGRRAYVPFVIAAAERDTFLAFELSTVVPTAALARLGAAVSKNPYVLTPVERAGVRRA